MCREPSCGATWTFCSRNCSAAEAPPKPPPSAFLPKAKAAPVLLRAPLYELPDAQPLKASEERAAAQVQSIGMLNEREADANQTVCNVSGSLRGRSQLGTTTVDRGKTVELHMPSVHVSYQVSVCGAPAN